MIIANCIYGFMLFSNELLKVYVIVNTRGCICNECDSRCFGDLLGHAGRDIKRWPHSRVPTGLAKQ